MPTGQALANLMTSVAPGMRYVYGAAPDPSDPHPRAADCSGYVRWGYVRETGNTAFPFGSATQTDYCLRHGLGITKAKAAATPGAALARGFANGPLGHIVISRGTVNGVPMTIEAHSRHTTPQVGSWPIIESHFDIAFLLPGIDYSTPTPPFPPPDWSHTEVDPMICLPGDAAADSRGRWPHYLLDPTQRNLCAMNGATLQGSSSPFGIPFVHVPSTAPLTGLAMSPRDDAVIVMAADGGTFTYPR